MFAECRELELNLVQRWKQTRQDKRGARHQKTPAEVREVVEYLKYRVIEEFMGGFSELRLSG